MDDFEINKIEIKYKRMGTGESLKMDGLCHQKVLPWLSVAQAVEGSYDVSLGKLSGRRHNTGEGGIFIAPPNVPQTIIHRANKESGRMKIRWIFLDVVINGVYRPEQLFDFPLVIEGYARERMDLLLTELFSAEDICDKYSIYYRIIKLLFTLGKKKIIIKNNSMESVMDYIYANYAQTITVSGLASMVYMSESNFYGMFKKQFGISPLSYVNRYRLSIASELLLRTDSRISDIAESVGFSDPLYFSKMFRKSYAVSPSEYRRINRIKE